MTLLIFPRGSSYTLSQGLVNSDVYVSTYCKNSLFFVCTYHKNSLQLFGKGQLAREGGIWSFALLFMKVWRILFTYSCFVSFVSWYFFLYHWRSSLFITLEMLENRISLLGGLLTVLLLLILKDGVIRVSRGREENTLLRI